MASSMGSPLRNPPAPRQQRKDRAFFGNPQVAPECEPHPAGAGIPGDRCDHRFGKQGVGRPGFGFAHLYYPFSTEATDLADYTDLLNFSIPVHSPRGIEKFNKSIDKRKVL